MADKMWKADERTFAKMFGAERAPLSGGNGKQTRSDTLHPSLFIEVKRRKADAHTKLFRETAEMAKVEGKIPVVCTHRPGSRDWLVTCRVEDLRAVFEERISTRRCLEQDCGALLKESENHFVSMFGLRSPVCDKCFQVWYPSAETRKGAE